VSPPDSSGSRGRTRPSAEERRRDLRRRRSSALVILLGGLAVIVAFVVWASRGGSGPGDATPESAAEQAPLQVVARRPQPALPAPAAPALAVNATGGSGMQVRVVATPKGSAVMEGPWRPAAKALPVPADITEVLEAGPIPGHVEVRDDAGRTARSSTLLLPATRGTGTAEVIRSLPTTRPNVALVFDDGLEESSALRIVDILRRTKSGGTFCFNGVNVKDWTPSAARKIQAAVADGVITMCSHGWSHRTSTSTSESEAMSDLSANASMDRFIGVDSVPYYRPPYGAVSPGIEAAAGKLGYRWIVMWDVDPSDYEKPDVATLTSRVVEASGKGSIVVLHAVANTADALPGIISGLKRKGLRAVTLTKMFGDHAAAKRAATSTSTTPVTTGGDAPPVPGEGT
jgi:peptidoglycan/xylan/chitin deacetylase (PgdA/CDA1 family)